MDVDIDRDDGSVLDVYLVRLRVCMLSSLQENKLKLNDSSCVFSLQ